MTTKPPRGTAEKVRRWAAEAARQFLIRENRVMMAIPAKTITCRAPPSTARCSSVQSRTDRLPGTAVMR